MTTPKRIQLRRTKGWRKPEGAIVVSRPSKWGNRYKVATGCQSTEAASRAIMAALYQQDLVRGSLGITVDDVRAELRGHDLACWCPLDQPCHADVLLEIANQETR